MSIYTQIISQRINRRIWNTIRDRFYNERITEAPLVMNINNNGVAGQQKALLSYLPAGYFMPVEELELPRTIQFEIFKIVKVLSELNYSIDIIGANDVRSINHLKSRKYDLIFGFGEAFYQMTELQPSAVSVIYMTEHHPNFSFREEIKRIDYFYSRHGRKVPVSRSGKFYKLNHLHKKYDFLITMSEKEPYKDLYLKPYQIFPTGILNPGFRLKDKDHSHTRRHFLWLGSTAVIHKGLDLLVDIISRRKDIYLHVCGLDDHARKLLELTQSPNIIDYGFIDIRADTFLKIVDTCTYSILPSCSEGFATSIAASMLHGLIPVVMRNTGFNRLENNAIFLDDYRIEYLDLKIAQLAQNEPQYLSTLSNKVNTFAQNNFSLEHFENSIRECLEDIQSNILKA